MYVFQSWDIIASIDAQFSDITDYPDSSFADAGNKCR